MKLSKEKEQMNMKKKTLGMMIATLRKENGMTQLELAQKMGVTDKAVSKWERDLSCPDVNSIPQLAELLGVSVDELMLGKKEQKSKSVDVEMIFDTALKGVGLAMGVAVAVLSFLEQIDIKSAMGMLGIGLACVAISLLTKKENQQT